MTLHQKSWVPPPLTLCFMTFKGKIQVLKVIQRSYTLVRGSGMYLKILRTRKVLSQTWLGQYSKMRFFKALSQNMVRTSPCVLICSGAPACCFEMIKNCDQTLFTRLNKVNCSYKNTFVSLVYVVQCDVVMPLSSDTGTNVD